MKPGNLDWQVLRFGLALALVGGLAQGCAPGATQTNTNTNANTATATGAGAGAPFKPVLEMHDLMASVLDPATDVIWGAAGTVITDAGEQDLAPTDDAGWQNVFNAAAIITETGNLLMLPGRAEDGEDWMEYSAALISTGEEAMAAAKAQDADAVFDVGGKLYLICVACHQSYDLEMDSATETGS